MPVNTPPHNRVIAFLNKLLPTMPTTVERPRDADTGLLVTLLWLALIGAGIYVAIHFIVKYW